MPKPHLMHVVPTLRAGGMEMALARIANGLLAEGMSQSVVVLRGDAIIADRFDRAVRLHCLHAEPHDVTVPLRLRRLIQAERPGVIHARNLGAWFDIALARLSVWPVAPLVFSFHGLAEAKPLPLRWRLMARVLARVTTAIFTVSEGSRRFLADGLGLPAARIAVIPNGVDTARFAPAPNPAASPGRRIGTMGSLTRVKNQALLVRVCHRLAQEGCDLRLDIAGEGPERPALEGLVRALGMEEYIRLLGHVENTPVFLQGLDVFALPSDSEAHPNALSEAMACGLACVASRVGGVPEILDDGRAGSMFEAGDEQGLADGLRALLGQPALRRELGARARRRVCGHYSMNAMLAAYRGLYLGLSEASAEASAASPQVGAGDEEKA